MSRLFDDASLEYLYNATAPLTAVPITMACWFNSDDITLDQSLITIGDTTGGGTDFFELLLAGAGIADCVRASTTGGGAGASANATANYVVNQWHHACAVFEATNSRYAYYDGGNAGWNATNRTPVGLDTVSVGAWKLSAISEYMSGMIAEVAIWDVALSADEVLALGRGASPLTIHPQNLVCYWPLIQGNDNDFVGGFNLTAVNTPSISDQPPGIFGRVSGLDAYDTGGGGGAAAALAAFYYRMRRKD